MVAVEYFKAAKNADGGAENGPMTQKLKDYGKDGEVVGLVFGGFLEVSEGVHSLIDLIAAAKATTILSHVKDQKA